MTFDRFLTWRDHIKDLVERCKKDMNVLRLVSGTNFFADKKKTLLIDTKPSFSAKLITEHRHIICSPFMSKEFRSDTESSNANSN